MAAIIATGEVSEGEVMNKGSLIKRKKGSESGIHAPKSASTSVL